MTSSSVSNTRRTTSIVSALAAFIMIATPAPGGASEWVWQNPLPQGNTLNDVHFADAFTGLAVGAGGTVLRTIDGGLTWIVLFSGWDMSLNGVYLTDGLNGFVVGNEGLILRTEDGGYSWSQIPSGTTETLESVYMTAGGRGFIAGWGRHDLDDKILGTSNAGDSWEVVPCGAIGPLEDLVFADEHTGVAVGWKETIVRSVDGGDNWTVVMEDPAGRFLQLFAVAFADANTGLAVGREGLTLRTVDGGSTWSRRPISTPNWLKGVSFFNGGIASAAGLDFFRSADSGYSWSTVSNPSGVSLVGLTVNADGVGVAVGTGGAILRSVDAGATWTDRQTGYADVSFAGVHFTDPSTGIAIAYSGDPADRVAHFLRTSDGGATWRIEPGGSEVLTDLSFPDPFTGVAVGNAGVVLKTTDGGNSWAVQNSGVTERLAGVSMLDADVGTTVGMNGTILRTADGGVSWTPQDSGTDEPLWDVCMIDMNHAVIVGDYTILRTTDGGATWMDVPHPVSNSWLYGVSFADADNGLAVGDFAAILSTSDGGATWETQHVTGDDAEVLWAVSFPDPSNAMAVGFLQPGSRNCLRTSDGGATWTPERTGAVRMLSDIYYDGSMATVVGYGGAILRAEDLTVPAVVRQYDSEWKNGRVEIRWRLIEAEGELSFNIERALDSENTFVRLPGAGVRWWGGEYVYEDNTVEAGETYRYRVRVLEDGVEVASFESLVVTIAAALALQQNHPNPFNPATQIPFVIDGVSHVTLSVYDISGRLVRTLVDRRMRPGSYTEQWDGTDARGNRVASGVYFYRLTAGKTTLSRKSLLLK